ncbi:hypothetical protein Psta_3653 [Pirellula staleyi DSM 6068]|uniref:Uncharacterized protein n=1 Tax=Pirellula staleyi (strain ATCC 27377 / DSM 6068 / ICPB 4128) TaxID=530564 RepID=D2QZC1_PIRSD|nr:hypothetical protein [Pirellula staleyi]ADB18313.1 hypothetical protein Psta_3653 [Pirellula staleyi DSM 6068]
MVTRKKRNRQLRTFALALDRIATTPRKGLSMIRTTLLITAATMLLIPSSLFAQTGMPGQSIVRPVGHAAWADYHSSEMHGASLHGGCGCGCSAPIAAGPCCNSCQPCCRPLLSIVPNAIRGVGRVLSCILPCNKCCHGGCGIGGCSSGCCDAGPSCGCSSGMPTMMHSDPFMDDPVAPPMPPRETRAAPSRYPSYVSPKVASRPVTARPTTQQRTTTMKPAVSNDKVASQPTYSGVSRAAHTDENERSVLKTASAETEVAAPRKIVAPPLSARRISSKSDASLTNFEVPVNPLRK